jgi:hypothetical protein
MYCFALHRQAASARHKNHYVAWTADCAREAVFWAANFARLNTGQIWPKRRWTPCKFRTRCDAGEPGWGMWVDEGQPQDEEPPDSDIAHGFWTRAEKRRSSTWRELRGFQLAFIAMIVPRFAGESVLCLVDAQNVETLWLSGGSRQNAEHHRMIREIFELAQQHGIELRIQWIPREENTRADIISKFFDTSDWKISPAIFRRLERRWGSPAVDLFATHLNRLVPRFFSRFWCPGTHGVDSFARDWGQFPLCWCNPPFGLIAQVLAHAAECGARLILIVPAWRQQSWWPTLRSNRGRDWATFVHGAEELPREHGTFLPGAVGANEHGVGAPDWQCYALLCDFRAAQ